MTARTRTTPSIAPPLPDDLSGWHWIAHPSGSNELAIEAPGQSWRTKWYFHPTKAIAEARRRVQHDEPAAPAPIDVQPGSSATLTLSDLVVALDVHAAALRGHLDQATTIPLPAGLPSQFDAPIDVITPGRYQPRREFAEESLQELATSIGEHGVLNRLKVFANERGELELIAGERRLRAAKLAGLSFVPIEICALTLRQIHEVSIVDNLQRADLSPAEEGTAYERMITELTISEAELSRRIGKNRAYIQQRRAVAAACPEVLRALTTEAITFSQARAIAQAAPGVPKAQQAALARLAEWTKQGRRVTETDARTATEGAVVKSTERDLEALGWSVSTTSRATYIWSPGDRPRVWTGAEMLAAVREQLRPSAQARTEIIDPEDTSALELCYFVDIGNYGPWVRLTASWEEPPQFYAPSELAAVRAELEQTIASMQARYGAAGWQLHRHDRHHWRVTHPDGADRVLYNWYEVVSTITKIEVGKIETTEAKQYTPQQQVCAGCKAKTSDYDYFERAYYCKPCLKQEKARARSCRVQIRQTITPLVHALVASTPLALIRAMVSAAGGEHRRIGGPFYGVTERFRSALAGADAAALQEELIDQYTEELYQLREDITV